MPVTLNEHDFAVDLLSRLPFEPNDQQMKTAYALARFCQPGGDLSPLGSRQRVFILGGYAGTGKTSMVGALVNTLREQRVQVMLLAPTGRAAKVMAANAGYPAATIHRKIYHHALPGMEMRGGPGLRNNDYEDTIFIVDEASMISFDSRSERGGDNTLLDLVQYVYAGRGCKMILVGDRGQLPPVGMHDAPAMEAEVLRGFGLKVSEVTMTKVSRQHSRSGILAHATKIRRILMSTDMVNTLLKINTRDFSDVDIVEPDELPELLEGLYGRDGVESTVIITRSNRKAVDFNQGIRAGILYREERLTRGDIIIASKNNYVWARKIKDMGFIANGELLRVERIIGYELRYGLEFVDAELAVQDRPEVTFVAKLLLAPLTSDSNSISPEVAAILQRGVYNDPDLCAPDAAESERIAKMRQSPYLNALQVKFAYAMTCHKAQGGQWDNVIIDLSYIPTDALSVDFYRWLYTAVTRARKHVYFISPPAEMRDDNSEAD